MTWRRYRRLFIVLVLPLLVFGFAVAKWSAADRSVAIDCDWLYGTPLCREYERSEEAAEFSVSASPGSGLLSADTMWRRYHITSRPLLLRNAKIINSLPYLRLSDPERARLIAEELAGKIATVHLSGVRNSPSVLISDRAQFQCGSLSKYFGEGRFEAHCWGGEYSGVHTFETYDDDQTVVKMLADDLDRTIASIEGRYVEHFVVLTLLPVFAFLALSGVAWLIGRAVSYARAA